MPSRRAQCRTGLPGPGEHTMDVTVLFVANSAHQPGCRWGRGRQTSPPQGLRVTYAVTRAEGLGLLTTDLGQHPQGPGTISAPSVVPFLVHDHPVRHSSATYTRSL